MRKGSRPKREQTRAKLLHAAVVLLLKKGYQRTTTPEISRMAGYSPTMFYAAFEDKEALLHELVSHMFNQQFAMAESLLVGVDDPVQLYGAETALQLHIAELSEPLRDLYVTAYSLPTTAELIFQGMARKLGAVFGPCLPEYGEREFYELEIASGGIMRAYMARACDAAFPIENKIRRFLEASLKVYEVPREKREEVARRVARMELHAMAKEIVAQTVRAAEAGFIAQTNVTGMETVVTQMEEK